MAKATVNPTDRDRSFPGLGSRRAVLQMTGPELCDVFLTVSMLTELYIEALLGNEELADQVWVLWN